MVWKPGQSGNLNGRPRKYPKPPEGMSTNDYLNVLKRDEYRYTAEAQDLEDPVLFQHRLLADETIPKTARAVIANQIACYYRPKLGVMELPKYVVTPIEVPDFTSVEEAEAFLLQLAQREAAQELDTESVATVSARILDWVRCKRMDQELAIKRLNADGTTGEQVIRIEGGLPELPGSDVIMPQLNGHSLELTAQPAVPQSHPPEPDKATD
jgi:hypothetical protein